MPIDSEAPAILVVGPSWVGDMVMAQSLFKLLRARMPRCTIDVVAPTWSLPLVERMPEVRDGYALDVEHGEVGIGKRYRLGKRFRGNNYDRAIVLPRSLKSALVPYFAGIPRRTGFKGEMRYGLINEIRPFDKRTLNQTVKRYCYFGLEDTGDELQIIRPGLATNKENARRCMAELGLDTDRFTVALLMGAEYGPAKQWPASHCAELVKQISDAGAQTWLLGSEKERAFAQDVIDQADGSGVDLCGKTRLVDVIDLIAEADLAVANDSGLMHIAAAVGTNVIAIYGSSSPEFTPPLCDDAIINWLRLDCSPCFERRCRFGHYDCLKNITAATVFDQLALARDDIASSNPV